MPYCVTASQVRFVLSLIRLSSSSMLEPLIVGPS